MATKQTSSNNVILYSANNIMEKIELELAKKMNTEVKSSKYDSQLNSSSTSGIDELKSQISIGEIKNNGKKVTNVTLPSKVVDTFAEPILSKIDESTITKYSKTDWWKQCMSQVIAAVNDITSKSVPINGVKYNIEYSPLTLSINKIGSISAKVTWKQGKNNYETTLKWENFSKSTLQSYYDSLKELGNALVNDVWVKLATGLVSDGSKVIKALYGKDSNQNLLKQVFGNEIIKKATKYQLKSSIKEILSSKESGKKVISAAESYESLAILYSDLETAINKNGDVNKASCNFIKTCNSIEKSLGISQSTLNINTSIEYNKQSTTLTIPAFYTNNKLTSKQYKSTVITIDATNYNSGIEIQGNDKNNYIQGGNGNDIFSGGKGNDNIEGNDGNDSLSGGDGKDIIYGGSGNDTILGGAGEDSLYGDTGIDKLYGNNGNDTLIGGKGNDYLTGGKGNDVFYYSAGDGNEIITDYTAGEDTIFIGSGVIKKASMNGNNAIFNFANNKKSFTSNGKITIQKGKNKNITFVDDSGSFFSYFNGKLTNSDTDTTPSSGETVNYNGITVTLSTDASGTFKLDEYNNGKNDSKKAVNIDATASKNNLNIYGNDAANIIQAGDGYVYIHGGKGNDHIYSSKNYTTEFSYAKGDGNDTLYNLKNNDKIYLSNCKVKNVSASNSDVILNLDDGSKISLKNSLNKQIYITGLGTQTFDSYSPTTNTFTLDNNFYGTFNLSNYDLSDEKKSITIDATTATNYHYIYSGKGNDHIYSSKNYTTEFSYAKGDGNDTLYNLKNNDKIYLSNCKVKNVSTGNSDIVLNLDTGNTITLKNSFNKNIYITGLGTVSYASTSNYIENNEERWFIEDNNYITYNTDQLTSILQDDNAINTSNNVLGEITNYNMSNILQNNQSKTVISYSESNSLSKNSE